MMTYPWHIYLLTPEKYYKRRQSTFVTLYNLGEMMFNYFGANNLPYQLASQSIFVYSTLYSTMLCLYSCFVFLVPIIFQRFYHQMSQQESQCFYGGQVKLILLFTVICICIFVVIIIVCFHFTRNIFVFQKNWQDYTYIKYKEILFY